MVRSEALPKRITRRPWPGRATTEQRGQPHEARAGAYRDAPTVHYEPLPQNLVGLTIVVVDDDEWSLDYFATALRTCGAVVLTASTAPAALQQIQAQRPDAVLSDIAMVGQDGYWLIGEIRALADDATKRVPVVAATAFGVEHSRERVMAAGFSEHLRKPVDPEVLCRTIGRLAGR